MRAELSILSASHSRPITPTSSLKAHETRITPSMLAISQEDICSDSAASTASPFLAQNHLNHRVHLALLRIPRFLLSLWGTHSASPQIQSHQRCFSWGRGRSLGDGHANNHQWIRAFRNCIHTSDAARGRRGRLCELSPIVYSLTWLYRAFWIHAFYRALFKRGAIHF